MQVFSWTTDFNLESKLPLVHGNEFVFVTVLQRCMVKTRIPIWQYKHKTWHTAENVLFLPTLQHAALINYRKGNIRCNWSITVLSQADPDARCLIIYVVATQLPHSLNKWPLLLFFLRVSIIFHKSAIRCDLYFLPQRSRCRPEGEVCWVWRDRIFPMLQRTEIQDHAVMQWLIVTSVFGLVRRRSREAFCRLNSEASGKEHVDKWF